MAEASVGLPARTRSASGASRWTLRLVAVAYVSVLVVLPLLVMVGRTFEDGLGEFVESVAAPEAIAAITLSLEVAAVAVVVNTVFGVAVSLLITRYRFRGRNVLNALIDLPVSVSPVIAGLALILVYGSNGWFGGFLQAVGIQVIYSIPGIVLATCFVSLPLVVRELIPVLDEIGLEQEQAGRSLGASAWQRLWRLTLPSVRWALAYGVVLSLARSLGEFGAVKVVSGNVELQTQTATLVVEQKYQNFEQSTSYATAFLLAAAAVVCIVIVSLLRPKETA